MWEQRRVLKKEQKQLNKKRLLFCSLFSGGFGILLIGIGYLILTKEPIFTSPLPLFASFGGSSEKDESKQTIERFLREHHIQFTEVKQLGKTTYKILQGEETEIYLTSEKGISEQLASLQRIISRLTMEGKKFLRLDLRYDKPVIVLQ